VLVSFLPDLKLVGLLPRVLGSFWGNSFWTPGFVCNLLVTVLTHPFSVPALLSLQNITFKRLVQEKGVSSSAGFRTHDQKFCEQLFFEIPAKF
jgi:hypothetical protein